MEFNIDILKLGKADATIIWCREDAQHYVVFLDGGEKQHAGVVLRHYEQYILPHVGKSPYLVAVNTHMHSDHLGGLQEIVETLHKDMKAVFFNNPTELLTKQPSMTEKLELLISPLASHRQFITESLDQAQQFGDRLKQLNIIHSFALAGMSLLPKPFDQYLRIIGPSPNFYRQMMRKAKQPWALQNAAEPQLVLESAGGDPCVVVAAHQDDCPYNKASVIVELITQQNKKYLFTADASTPSFEAVLDDSTSGSDLSDYYCVQLPHHGSWHNFDKKWATRFEAKLYWVSAPGGPKHPEHPRQELIDCLKQEIKGVAIYSTHNQPGNWLRFTTSKPHFPRKTVPAQTL